MNLSRVSTTTTQPSEQQRTLSFELNGKMLSVSAPAGERLSTLLREQLELTGTKVGCDAGDCGACTILLDDRQVCACMVAFAQIEGRRITTVEGLTGDPRFARLQRAFHRHGAAQCGICTPGMLLAACDLLQQNSQPDAGQVADALGGVLCRCTGYRKIIEAVLAAADVDVDALSGAALDDDASAATLTAPAPLVGSRWLKSDGAGKVDGSDRFGADHAPSGCLWLRTIRSPHARACFQIGDPEPVYQRFPGLVRILSAADIPGNNRFGIYPDLKDQPVLADGEVRFRGEAVLALVGDKATLELITIDDLPLSWQPLPPVSGIAAALAAGAPVIHMAKPDNILIHGKVVKGAIEILPDDDLVSAEGRWQTSFVEHAYIEPEAGYAVPLPDGRIELVVSTQTPYMDRDEVAQVLGIAAQHVRIRPTCCGGGFGGKLDMSVQPLIASAAWLLQRPVRCIYNRIESMASTTKRHPASLWAQARADRNLDRANRG